MQGKVAELATRPPVEPGLLTTQLYYCMPLCDLLSMHLQLVVCTAFACGSSAESQDTTAEAGKP